MSVARTAWNARWVYLLTLLLSAAWAYAGRTIAASMVEFVLGPFGGETGTERALAHLAELVVNNPELPVGLGGAVVLTAAVGWLAWTTLGGVVFFALRGDDMPDAIQRGVRVAGPLLVHSLVHAALTAVGIVLLSVILGPAPAVLRLLGLFVGLSIAVLARDLVRAQICLHPLERPYHPRAALRGFVAAIKRPAEIGITAGLWAAKIGVAVSLPMLAFRALGPDTVPAQLQLLGAVGLALTFVRLAWITRWVPVDLEGTDDGAQTASG